LLFGVPPNFFFQLMGHIDQKWSVSLIDLISQDSSYLQLSLKEMIEMACIQRIKAQQNEPI
jgi:hypothetical protein